MRIKRTERGFKRAEFKDQYGIDCSIQESSSGECIWLGCNKANPRVLAHQVNGGRPDGWVPLPLPAGVSMDDVLCDTRMHLTRTQVEALLPILARFVEAGDL